MELSYAFRLISKKTYDSLNVLRKIRNDAAHSSEEFNLIDVNLDQIFNLGEGFMTVVQESSAKMMVNLKFETIKANLVKEGLNEDAIIKFLSTKFQEEETLEILKNQLPHWKLIFGLSMICGMLRFYSEETTQKLQGIGTWSNLKIKNDD